MRETRILTGLAVAFLSTAAAAQLIYPQGNDPTSAGQSGSNSHMPSTNGADEYLHRQQMQDLANGTKKAGAKLGPARPAKPDELIAGAVVNDKSGMRIATIDQIEKDGIVLSDGGTKVKVPAEAFGHNNAGLLLDMTKPQFDEIVRQAHSVP